MNNITGECQAGFKRNYSITDHLFTLLALIQKQFSLNRKMYVAFIDFEKAFDSINWKLLWPIRLKNGIRRKLCHCIKSMYNSVKVRVRCGSKLTDYIKCTVGVKQGDVCSPFLFSLFINELTLEVIKKKKKAGTVHHLLMIVLNCLFCYWPTMLFYYQKQSLAYKHSWTVCKEQHLFLSWELIWVKAT